MSEEWKWSFAEAFSVVWQTYMGDWGADQSLRRSLIKSTYINEIQDEHIKGLESGEGQPVVFIHGSPGNAMRWQWFLKNPPSGYRIIAIDRMGYGSRGWERPNLEEDFQKTLKFVQTFKTPILVGHSLGGAKAIRLAAHADVKGLVLVASSIDPSLERILPIQKLGNSKFIKWVLSRSLRHSNEELMQLFNYMILTEGYLDDLKAPVHIVHAKDDGLVSYGNVDYAKAYFEHVTVTSLDGGGHVIPWTHPNLIYEAIESFGVNS